MDFESYLLHMKFFALSMFLFDTWFSSLIHFKHKHRCVDDDKKKYNYFIEILVNYIQNSVLAELSLLPLLPLNLSRFLSVRHCE